MERRSIYRKGSQGHARNVSSYRMGREKFKKWRTPITAFLALLVVFGSAPVVGENFQASLLMDKETASEVSKNPEQARKVLVNALHEFLADCDRFRMQDCSEHGQTLMKDIINSGDNLPVVLDALLEFESRYEPAVAKNACKYDLGKSVFAAKKSSEEVTKFFERYGEALSDAGVAWTESKLAANFDALAQVVETCAGR